MKQTLLPLTLIFCLGIFIARQIIIPFYVLCSLGGILLGLALLLSKKTKIFAILLYSSAFISGAILLSNSQNIPPHHIVNYISYENNPVYILKGVIESDPEVKNNGISFIFRVQEIQLQDVNYNCCGKIIVYIKSKHRFFYGDELILRGKISKPLDKSKRQRQSYQNYLRNNDIWFVFNVARETDIVNLDKNNGFGLKRMSLWLKNKSEGVIFKYTSPITAGVLDAMILGEKKNVPYFVTRSMMQSGTLHILVVSGFNVSLVTFIFIFLLKALRIPRTIRFYIIIPLAILYCFVTGSSNPVIRATVMATIFILSILIKREPNIYNSLSLAAMSILVIKPKQLFDVGFQLSFLSVFFIIYLYPKITAFFSIDAIKIRPMRYLAQGLAVSLSAWTGTALPIAYYFKIFSPITVIANLAIVPLASLITLTGFSLLFIHPISAHLASIFSYTDELLVAALINLNNLLLKVPFASISWN